MESEDSLIESFYHMPEVPEDKLVGKCKNRETSLSETSPNTDVPPREFNTPDYRMLEIKLKLAESTGNINADEADEFPDFEDLFSGQLPCTLLYFDRLSCSLTPIKTFYDLSKYVETTNDRRNAENRVLRTLVSAPAPRLVRFATLGKYLRNLYETDKLMDVRIDVDGFIFMAHRIALCCCSRYFSNLLTPEKYPKVPIRVEILGISANAFSAFLEFVYTGEITIDNGIIADILLISEYLEVNALKAKLEARSCNLTLQEAVRLLFMRSRDLSDNLYEAAFATVVDQFMPASMLAGFLDLDGETFCSLLQSDNLRVSSEFEVFQVAVRWIVHGTRARLQYVTSVMNTVRFCHMSQKELFNCLVETRLFIDYTELRDLILIANWVLTAVYLKKEDPFQFEVPPPRRFYIKNKHKNRSTVPSKNARPVLEEDALSGIPNPAKSSEHKAEGRLGYKYYVNLQTNQETSQQEKHSPRGHGKPLLLPPEVAASHRYTQLPETPTSRPTSVSPRYGKPVLLQQGSTQSFSLHSPGKMDLNERKNMTKKPNSASINQKRAMSPAGHAKPTIWSHNSNQSSNTSPDAKDIPPRSSSWSLQYQETLPDYGMTATRDTDESWNYVTYETTQVTNKDRRRCSSSRQIGQRYVISPLPSRSARPVVLPTEVRTVPDDRIVSEVSQHHLPEASQHHLPTEDIIVVGAFEENWISENGEDNPPGMKRRPIQYCSLPLPRRYFAVAMVENDVYVTGGYNPNIGESGVTNTVVQMDCSNRKWTIVEPMLEARMCHCACAVENKIYVFGGLDRNERPLSTCEYYNICTSQWSSMEPLPVPIYAGSAASLGGRCYLAGGLTRTGVDDTVKLLMTMACFDPKSNRWSFKGHLRMQLCHASLVNVQGRLYLCGGATLRQTGRRHELLSVAFIDEYNVLNNSWHFRTEMTSPRHEACVAVVGSRLYVIGGKNSAEENVVRTVECYDTRANVWIKCPLEMPFPARWIKCVTDKNKKEN